MADSEVRLGDAVMAFFIGPQSSEMSNALGTVQNPGYLVLVDADGSFRTVKTKHMDMMRPVWSDHGLHFADESSDYHLTASGLTKADNPKASAQNLMFALPNGESVGVYNGGHGDDGGYDNQVAVMTDGDTHLFPVQGNYFTGARCDGQIFGVAENPGNHKSQAPKRPGMVSTVDEIASPQMLARLYPADDGEKVIGWRPQFGTTPTGEVPCHEGVVTFLSWDTDAAGREQPNVVSWDTATGDHQVHRLTFDDATLINDADIDYVEQDWQGDRLHWVYADGRVFSTDSRTGKTTTLFDTKLGTGPDRPMQTLHAFSDTQLHTLSTTREGEGSLTYTVFHRANGATARTVSIPIPHAAVHVSYLNLSYMTVRPEV
ncbi:hypothetical protein AB0M36_32335 [Actinoplanes sp. NPDC051346]|uniref:hypothetical protein n=1 Tax=Actinoplanes sp. NPDC051346 TaxID=3155048 RepID=UPI003432EE9A